MMYNRIHNYIIQFLPVAFVMMAPVSLFSQKECGTNTPSSPYIVPEKTDRGGAVYMMKIFVTIFADDNGTNVACADSQILRQIENMQDFYAPHQICFQLIGITTINNSDLNTQNTDTEAFDLLGFQVVDAFNIFVHSTLFDNDDPNLNGSAYDIPNTYLSISRGAVTSITNRSTLAHEMGHCFGLYHTFETAYGVEEVPRTGTCRNCEDAGDLLCSTPADPNSDEYNIANHIDVNCNYTDDLTNFCLGVYYEYQLDPTNIMTYGIRACRDHFTSAQGVRAYSTITITNSLISRLSPGTLTFNSGNNTNITSGNAGYGAQTSMTVQGNTFRIAGTAHGHFVANAVNIKPNVHFDPGTGGFCHVTTVNPACD